MPIRILSIDGGGTRGLFPATLIDRIEQETAQPITSLFDIIIGSATGGIIATALAAGLRGHQIRDIYQHEARALLPKNFFRQSLLTNPLNLFRARYSNKGLVEALRNHIGETATLRDVMGRFGPRPIFLMPSLHLHPYLSADDIPGFKPVLFNSSRKQHQGEKLLDIAMRTSAAAVNLPIYQQYAEGGNYANDPCVFGLSFALNRQPDVNNECLIGNGLMGLGAKPEEIRLLSLGCGSTGPSFVTQKHLKNPDWGLLKWQRYLIALVIDSNMVANQYLTREILPQDRYLRINAYYKDESAPEVLRNRKLKIDVTDQDQLDAIRQYADATYDLHRDSILSFINSPT